MSSDSGNIESKLKSMMDVSEVGQSIKMLHYIYCYIVNRLVVDTSVIFLSFKVSAKLKAAEEEKNSLENRLEIEMQSRRDMEGRCSKDTYDIAQK